MTQPVVLGLRTVAVDAVEKELRSIWKSIAPKNGDDTPAVMQASMVNLVAVAASAADSDAAAEIAVRLVSLEPCKSIVLDSEPEADPPGMTASVSVACEKQICCEQIRVAAKGISADALPSTVEAFYTPDLPVMVWWSAPLNRRDFYEFAARADRMVIDSRNFGRGELQAVAEFISESRRTRTAVSDLNWARLTPYRQLFAQFFDSAEWREQLNRIEQVVVEGRESAGLMMAGWLLSRLDQLPRRLTPDRIAVKVSNGEGAVFRSLVMKCNGGAFAVRRINSETVESRAAVGGEATARVSRIPLAPVERLLAEEIGRSGRDRAYDAAVSAAAQL